MRNDAEDPDLPRRIDGPGHPALPAASAASPASAACDDHLPGRIGASGRLDLPNSAASAAASASSEVRRTRLNLWAGANRAGPFISHGAI